MRTPGSNSHSSPSHRQGAEDLPASFRVGAAGMDVTVKVETAPAVFEVEAAGGAVGPFPVADAHALLQLPGQAVRGHGAENDRGLVAAAGLVVHPPAAAGQRYDVGAEGARGGVGAVEVDANPLLLRPAPGVVGAGAEDVADRVGVGMGGSEAGVVDAVAARRQPDDVGGQDADGIQGAVEIEGDPGILVPVGSGVALVEMDGGDGIEGTGQGCHSLSVRGAG